jgi:hypothetical protein
MMAVQAVEEFHKVNIQLELMLPRPGRKGLMELRAVASKRLWSFGDRPPLVSRSVTISGGDPSMVVATTFRLVYDIDRDCGAMWAQAELFESV